MRAMTVEIIAHSVEDVGTQPLILSCQVLRMLPIWSLGMGESILLFL